MEAEEIEKLERKVDSSLMKLNKDKLIEIAAGINIDNKQYAQVNYCRGTGLFWQKSKVKFKN